MAVLGKGWKACWLLVAAVALSSLLAVQAAATTFAYLGGEVRVTAFRSDSPGTLLVDTILPLSGSFVDFQAAPVGITDFLLTIPQSPFTLSSSYGGYDEIILESATLTPGAGYTTGGLQTSAFTYDVDGAPVAVNAVYSATDSNNVNPPIMNAALPPFNTSFGGTVTTDLAIILSLIHISEPTRPY